MPGGELGARCSGRDAPVMGRMPRRRTDLGEEPFHLRLVRDQLAVEVPGVPIEQDAAHVEHHRLDRRVLSTLCENAHRLMLE